MAALTVVASEWEKVRDKFTEEEKADMRKAAIGEVLCPRCWVVDLGKMSPALQSKIIKHCGDKNAS